MMSNAITKVVSIGWFSLVRFFRERANLFFVFIFPLLIIAILGSQFGGDQTSEVGIVGDSEFTDRVIESLDETGAVAVTRVADNDELAEMVEDGSIALGVAVPDNAQETLEQGNPIELVAIHPPAEDAAESSAQLEGIVTRTFSAEAVVPSVTGELAGESGRPREDVGEVVSGLAEVVPEIEVSRTMAGGGDVGEEPFGFDQIAVGMLLLMTFLNAFTAATALIQSRRLGVSRRMVATPTSISTIVVGEAAGKWAIGMFQALYIMIGTMVLFDVSWGHLPTAVIVLALFSAVAAGGAMLVGALMSNDEQAAGITVMVGLAVGALGGTMFPLELFGQTMTAIAHATPHAWAIDAFTDMARNGATFVDVLPQIGVLAAYAALLIGIATWRLRIALTRA